MKHHMGDPNKLGYEGKFINFKSIFLKLKCMFYLIRSEKLIETIYLFKRWDLKHCIGAGSRLPFASSIRIRLVLGLQSARNRLGLQREDTSRLHVWIVYHLPSPRLSPQHPVATKKRRTPRLDGLLIVLIE